MAITRHMHFSETDRIESLLHTIDESVAATTGTSLFHILTFASITASIVLFARGRKLESIFVGLWPPTFQAMKAAADKVVKPAGRSGHLDGELAGSPQAASALAGRRFRFGLWPGRPAMRPLQRQLRVGQENPAVSSS